MLSRRRWRSRPAGKSKLRRNVALALIVLIILGIQGYMYVERRLLPPLIHLAAVRMKQLATETINSAISDRVSGQTDLEELIDWRTDAQGRTTGLTLNPARHMKITADTIRIVQQRLDELEKFPEHIPLGQALNSPILASFGPDIPIKLVPAGSAKVDLSTRYRNAGINMILVEVFIKIRVEITVIIPFDSAPEVVETELPVSYSLVVGDVPTYYFDGKGNPVGGSGAAPPGITVPGLNLQTVK